MTDDEENRAAIKSALARAHDDYFHHSRATVQYTRYYHGAVGSTFRVNVFITWTPTEYEVEVGLHDRPNNPFRLFQSRVSQDEYGEAILERVHGIVADPGDEERLAVRSLQG